jgi:phosphoglycerate dehydrogenase-like enzyme
MISIRSFSSVPGQPRHHCPVKPDVWIPDATTPDDRALLAPIANVHSFPAKGRIDEPLGHGDMLVAGHAVRAALEAIPWLDGLRVVQTFSAGVDAIVDRIPPGITLCDASGVHDVSVAEWVVLAILASNHRLAELMAAQRSASWLHERLTGDDLEGVRVLIVGYGSIGRAVESRLAPFGVEVVRVARHGRDGVHAVDDLRSLLSTADVVVILLPLTPATRGLIDSELLDLMPRGALLVNASRGGVVDTGALTKAVSQGRIRAALDVTDPEPLPDGHPLWTLPGVLITPHVAGDVRREEQRAWQLVIDQVGRLARGDPLRNVVVDGY